MWLFGKKGFFSIVQHKDDPKALIVRARVKGDIEKYWPDATIERNEEFDYLYRANLPREKVAPAISQMAKDIDYTNFKASIADKRRSHWYFHVWDTMCRMQEAFRNTEK